MFKNPEACKNINETLKGLKLDGDQEEND